MTSIGECLRRERLRRNLQLEQVASELKISARMLAAIEAEDFEKLPGGVFAKSFVRQYAHLLGLDEDEMAAEVARMLRPEAPGASGIPRQTSIPLPRMEAWESVHDTGNWNSKWSTWLPALMMVVVVMLVCSAVYAYLQRPRQTVPANQAANVRQIAPKTAQTPAATPPAATPATEPVSAPETGGAAAEAKPAPETVDMQTTAAPAAVPPSTSPVSVPGSTALAAAPSQAAPAPAATQGESAVPGLVHVEITALEPVWVRATSDGKYVFSGTIDTNQKRVVDGSETVLLRLGNAGGVNILLNGKPLGEVGPKGQVRNIQLTPGGFKIVAAPKSPVVDPL